MARSLDRGRFALGFATRFGCTGREPIRGTTIQLLKLPSRAWVAAVREGRRTAYSARLVAVTHCACLRSLASLMARSAACVCFLTSGSISSSIIGLSNSTLPVCRS